MPPLLELESLTCERGERRLFTNLSAKIDPGTLTRIVGSNGSGKTSLIRLLTGLARPLSGRVTYRGTPIEDAQGDYWKDLCYIGHKNGVKDELSALENVGINARLAGHLTATEDDYLHALDQVGLTDFYDAPVGQLSQGQRRRVALARLWLSQAQPVWVLDEPFTALDVKGVARLCDLMRTHIVEGGVVIYVTHQDVVVPGIDEHTLCPEAYAPALGVVERQLIEEHARLQENECERSP